MPSLADRLLKGCERDITVTFQGKVYPAWVLMESLLYIVDKNEDNVRFRLNRQQCRLYKAICEQRRQGKLIREDILKARQIGFTTFIAGLYFTIAMFTPNVSVGIVADTLEHSQGIFEKYQHFYDCLDLNNPNRELIEEDPKKYAGLSYKPTLRYNKGQTMLRTDKGNSPIHVMAVGDSAGRSKTYSLLHLSECAFWDNLGKTLKSLLKTVSRKNLMSMVFLETTGNGFNAYKDRWDRDLGGNSAFDAYFERWFDNPEYSEPIPEGYDLMAHLEPWELERMERYKVSPEKMNWYHNTYMGESDGDRNDVLQEYPFSPVDAFVASGNTVFDKELIAQRKSEILDSMAKKAPEKGRFTYSKAFSEDGSRIEMSGIAFADTRNGPISIMSKPVRGRPYVVTCDPNMGGSDDVAIQVVDNCSGRQVARFKSNELPLDECAYQLYCLGRMYNWALMSSETNVGQIVMDLLIKMRYPKLYVAQSEAYENFRETVKVSYGHKTTKGNRQFMIDSFAMAFRQDPTIVSDYDTICEMESFQLVERYDGKGNVTSSKQEAAGGAHDDLVMAFAAFYLVRGQQSAVPDKGSDASGRKMTLEEIDEAVERKSREARVKSSQKGFGISW
ncbi:MAG: hypothetical protein LKG11_00745 [Bacilli bacterium]|jgi:hypothetical protein|nr:hypothetical protein [Bacilli bacterium]